MNSFWKWLIEAISGLGSKNLKPVSARRGSSAVRQKILALRQVPTQRDVQVLGLRGAEREEGSKGALHVIPESCDNSYGVIITLSLYWTSLHYHNDCMRKASCGNCDWTFRSNGESHRKSNASVTNRWWGLSLEGFNLALSEAAANSK